MKTYTKNHLETGDLRRKSKNDSLSGFLSSAGLFSNSLNSDSIVQRKAACACGGGCPACRDDSIIQTKLTVGEPDDQYEQEADKIAAHVMRMPHTENVETAAVDAPGLQMKPLAITPVGVSQISRLQRQIGTDESAEENLEEVVQTKRKDSASEAANFIQTKKELSLSELPFANNSAVNVQRQFVAESDESEKASLDQNEDFVQTKSREAEESVALKAENSNRSQKTQNIDLEDILGRKRGSGTGLPNGTRDFMESRFGVDFGGVRIHQDDESNRLNRHLNSLAFTTGQDIYFSSGTFRPGTSEGNHLLAHELTHVVQQTGGTHLQRKIRGDGFYIQRYNGDEDKLYTRDSLVIPGSVAHRSVEKILERDTSLMTEAPIPGGTSSDQGLNLVGFADLYKSDGNIVSGVHGFYSKSDEGVEPDRITPDDIAAGKKPRQLNHKNMPTPASSKIPGSKWAKLSSGGAIKHGPRLKDKSKTTGTRDWDVTPDFPANFQVGEIKPLSFYKVTAGGFQLNNYITGFTKFVEETHKSSGGATRASISGSPLDLALPDEIDYAKFDAEHSKPSVPKSLLVKSGKLEKRIWIYKLPDPKGLYVYFGITHPYAPTDYPAEVDRILTGLDPLLKELREKHPKIPGKIATKRIDKSVSPAEKQIENKTEKPKISRKSAPNMIQRNTPPDKNYWAKRGAEWGKSHKKWDDGEKGAEKFIETTARGPIERQKIDEELKIPPGKDRIAGEAEKLKKIKLWSGKTGAALGKLRFYFGSLFDRLMTFFEKVKTKFEKWFKDSDKIKPKGKLSVGWVSTATKVILKFAVEIFKEVLKNGYTAFTACINGMVDKIIDRFTDELNEKLHEEMNPIAEKIADLHKRLDDEFHEYSKAINMFTEYTDQISQWKDILSGVEVAVRVGVQVVSCGTPPGLGCLWGLVAQMAIGTALELLTETSYFDNHIARPTANKLMKHFVGNAFQNMVASSVDALGLSKYAEGVAECARVNDTDSSRFGFFGATGAFDPNAPDVVKARQAWEAKHHDSMMADLLKAFQRSPEQKGEKPKPMSKEDIEKLIEALKKANLDPETLRAMIDGAKKKGSKKVKFDEFLKEIEKVPGEDRRTATADTPQENQPEQGGATAPPAVPPVEKGNQKNDQNQGEPDKTAPQDDQTVKIPLFDADRLTKVDDGNTGDPLPDLFFKVRPDKTHEKGKVYEVMIDMFENIPTYEVTASPNAKEDETSAPVMTIQPYHIYSVSNVKVVVLSIDPHIVKGARQGTEITYQILENVQVEYKPSDTDIPRIHVIPKKKITGILK